MDLKRSINKARRKQLLLGIALSVLGVMIISIVAALSLDRIATRKYHFLIDSLTTYQASAPPNVRVESQYISGSSIIGGNVLTEESKNIDGYIVPWETYSSRYGLFKVSLGGSYTNEFYHSSKNLYEYNRQTAQKVATFYHPSITKYYGGVKNELSAIEDTDNYVAEVALSFDKPYSYNEVKKMIPNNVNVVWLHLFSEKEEEEFGPSGLPTFGFQLDVDEENITIDIDGSKTRFFDAFEEYFSSSDSKEEKAFLKKNKDKAVDDIEVLGVMVTGQAKNLKNLADAPYLRGSSIGVTAPIVSYITPEK